MLFLCLSVLQGSAETLFRWGGKINHISIQLPKHYVIFMPKIIEIRKCSFKLQLKMSGVFFETQCRILLQTATLVFPRSIVCSRLSNNINILAKKCQAANGGGMAPRPQAGSATVCQITSLCAAVMICATLVNRQTDPHAQSVSIWSAYMNISFGQLS